MNALTSVPPHFLSQAGIVIAMLVLMPTTIAIVRGQFRLACGVACECALGVFACMSLFGVPFGMFWIVRSFCRSMFAAAPTAHFRAGEK